MANKGEYKTQTVYTDGSCIDNQYADLARGGIGVYFGPDDDRNVSAKSQGVQTSYNAELMAIRCAVRIIHREVVTGLKDPMVHYAIATDSNSCLYSIDNYPYLRSRNANREALSVITQQINEINDVYRRNGIPPLYFYKVKAHSNNVGNSEADFLALIGALKNLSIS